jgi:hypothetical protein
MKIIFPFILTFVLGFGFKTHTFLGGLMDSYLEKHEPGVYANVLNILNNETIAESSVWADKVKFTKQYSYTKPLHYINIMECDGGGGNVTQELVDYYCKNNCIDFGILNFTDNFNDNKKDYLKFLIHFAQDFNQPMHVLGYKRGGNSMEITVLQHSGRNKTTNLHVLWDSIIPEFYIENFKFKIPRKIKAVNLKDTLLEILNINIKIACKIYPKDQFLIFDEYFNKSYMDILFTNYIRLLVIILKTIF